MDIIPFPEQLVGLLERLRTVEDYLAKARAAGEEPRAVFKSDAFDLGTWLFAVDLWCLPLGCADSLRQNESLKTILKSEDERDRLFESGELEFKVRALRELVRAEYGSRNFYYVPPDKVGLFKDQDLFGEMVQARFGKVSFHIKEAGKCLAFDRSTAAVYHLMCILDVGLDSLCFALGLPYSKRNWNMILQDLEGAIGRIEVPDQREFYSRAALEFKFFRDAWRNHAQHGRAKHTTDEALEIFAHVKAFMQHLATRLEERPDAA